jgi:ketosteroid isomerase-like protein
MDSPVADGRTLRQADQALASAVERHDRAAFEALLAEDAYFAGGGQPLRGRAAVSKGWASFFEPDGPRLSWAPELAEMSRSGDLGYTVGHYRFESRDAAGRSVKREGRYVTVWRKEADGAFRVALDSPLVPPADDGLPDVGRTADRTLSSGDGDLVVEAGTWRADATPSRGGSYLAIRRRTREGTLAAALETVVPAAPAGAD